LKSCNRSSFFGGLLWERSDRMFLNLTSFFKTVAAPYH